MDHESPRFARIGRFAIARAGWIVLGWLVLVAVLNVAVPQLEVVGKKDASPMVPLDAPSSRAVEAMNKAFGSTSSQSFLIIAMERSTGLTAADRRFVLRLAAQLRADTEDVSFVQDVRRPELLKALTSRDGEARYLQIGITGPTGAPASIVQVDAVRALVDRLRPGGLTVAVTGPTATVADLATETDRSVARITVVTIVMIGIILFLIYRRLSTPLVILTVVGLGLGLARAVTAWCGLHHVFAVSTFSGSFLTAVVLGAGTDYAVFIISRYHENRRAGIDPGPAAAGAIGRIGSVVAGSAVTVVVATSFMELATMGFFRTTGPAIAVSVAVNLLLSLTLTPALLMLAGRRGWCEPRPVRSSGAWSRVAGTVVAHPVRWLGISLVPLLLLALVYPAVNLSYDVRSTQPSDTESNDGYALLGRHFPINEVLPDYVLIQADHDLRNARDLALIERASADVARLPGVAMVRGITRPLGTPITQASIAYQSGRVGDRLGGASRQMASGAAGARRLSAGAGRLGEGAGRLATGAGRAANGADRLAAGTTRLGSGLARLLNGADRAARGSGRLSTGMRQLASGLSAAATQTDTAADALGVIYQALRTKSLTCGLDPACSQSRDGLERVWRAEKTQLVPGLRKAARAAHRLAAGTGSLRTGLRQLRGGIAQARAGATSLATGQRRFAGSLDQLSGGADRLATGVGALHDGTEQVATSLPRLRRGLAHAAAYLQQTRRVGRDPAVGGFYLPPAALGNRRFAAASGLFLSRDGRTARLVVLGTTNAFDTPAADRSVRIRRTVDDALRDTALGGAAVSTTGMASANHDLEHYSQQDLLLIAVCALLAVFLVLVLLLRAIVAAALLMLTVLLSYAAAMGASVLVWQVLLGVRIDWTVTAVSFVLLVAVGADYNLLLAKRMHEDAPSGDRAAIARATAVTGGVITSAGLIFASSMFAMLAGSVTTMGQVGFAIGIGLLLDTFIVRSMVVPSIAALLGRRLWWPQRIATGGPAS
ncbi:MMPL family transporter [Nocardioides ultimimeridianus]